jgi:hypothetical protein
MATAPASLPAAQRIPADPKKLDDLVAELDRKMFDSAAPMPCPA